MVDPNASSQSAAVTYLVETMIGGEPHYMICARLDGPVPLEAIQGVTREQIESLFGRGTLRAAPLPPPMRPVLRTASAEQSMNDVDWDGGG